MIHKGNQPLQDVDEDVKQDQKPGFEGRRKLFIILGVSGAALLLVIISLSFFVDLSGGSQRTSSVAPSLKTDSLSQGSLTTGGLESPARAFFRTQILGLKPRGILAVLLSLILIAGVITATALLLSKSTPGDTIIEPTPSDNIEEPVDAESWIKLNWPYAVGGVLFVIILIFFVKTVCFSDKEKVITGPISPASGSKLKLPTNNSISDEDFFAGLTMIEHGYDPNFPEKYDITPGQLEHLIKRVNDSIRAIADLAKSKKGKICETFGVSPEFIELASKTPLVSGTRLSTSDFTVKDSDLPPHFPMDVVIDLIAFACFEMNEPGHFGMSLPDEDFVFGKPKYKNDPSTKLDDGTLLGELLNAGRVRREFSRFFAPRGILAVIHPLILIAGIIVVVALLLSKSITW